MKRLLITAMGSGSGKTMVTCALLRALRNRGVKVRGAKSGPDYIDPMYHAWLTGRPGLNLDYHLMGERGVRRALARASRDTDILLVEGAMGYFDGKAGTDAGSAWDLARREDIPAVLVLRPTGSALTLAAQVRGMMSFRTPHKLAALILNDCRASLYEYLKPILERECGLPVPGFIPPLDEARVEERHLGLVGPGETGDMEARFDSVARVLEQTLDLDLLLAAAGAGPEEAEAPEAEGEKTSCVIAVARDEAFRFYYEESLEQLRRAGASLAFFSPMRDRALPGGTCGLYLGGGYPELYAAALSANEGMRQQVRERVEAGMPCVAECGGFLYLLSALRDGEGRTWPMAGVFPGTGFPAGRLVRFGYLTIEAPEDSLLFRKGERIPAHEFHHWDTEAPGEDLLASRERGDAWRFGCASPSLYAAFPHLHLGGELPLAERFVRASERYGDGR